MKMLKIIKKELICCLAIVSCDKCEGGASGKVKDKTDHGENLQVQEAGYTNSRKKVTEDYTKLFGIDLNTIIPEWKAVEEMDKDAKISVAGKRYVNNLIAKKSELDPLKDEIYRLMKLIDNVNDQKKKKKLNKDLKQCLSDFKTKFENISTTIEKNMKSENQYAYGRSHEIFKAFDETVVTKILPEIINSDTDTYKDIQKNIPQKIGASVAICCSLGIPPYETTEKN